jgi:hypothetical protein
MTQQMLGKSWSGFVGSVEDKEPVMISFFSSNPSCFNAIVGWLITQSDRPCQRIPIRFLANATIGSTFYCWVKITTAGSLYSRPNT